MSFQLEVPITLLKHVRYEAENESKYQNHGYQGKEHGSLNEHKKFKNFTMLKMHDALVI